jgi:hypothetical protein
MRYNVTVSIEFDAPDAAFACDAATAIDLMINVEWQDVTQGVQNLKTDLFEPIALVEPNKPYRVVVRSDAPLVEREV